VPFLSPLLQLLVASAISLAIGFGGGWATNGWRLGAEISQLQSQQAINLSNGLKTALEDTTRYQRNKDDALKKAESRAAAAAASAAANRAESDGLRAQLEQSRSSIPNATHDSLRAYATTINTVFGECQREYEALGRHATSHASDSLTLQMSWPKDTQ
jgi:hypothetical protein